MQAAAAAAGKSQKSHESHGTTPYTLAQQLLPAALRGYTLEQVR